MPNDSSVDRVVTRITALASELGAGGQLPSTRVIAGELGAGPVTVQQALQRLVAQGMVETRPGVGTFVASKPGPMRADTSWQEVALGSPIVQAGPMCTLLEADVPGVLQMGGGHLDESLRAEAKLAQAMARAARRPGVWGAQSARGLPELREWFASQLHVGSSDVLITPAGQAALSATLRAVARPGQNVLFATPAYPGALAIARSAGFTPVGVPADREGIRVDLLESAIERSGAQVLYLQPTYANPDGSVLTPSRRAQLLAIARRHQLVIVEDDWARWLGHGGDVPAPLQADDRHGHVVTICSLSKASAPSLRVGAVIARGVVGARIADLRMVDDLFVAGPLQHAAVELVSAPSWRGHLKALSGALASRAATLGALLGGAGLPVTVASGGFSLWLELPAGVNDLDVAREASIRRLHVLPGSHYHLSSVAPAHLRLSFAALPEQDMPEAVSRLTDAIGAASS